MITGKQVAMARVGLGLGTRELGELAGVAPGTINRYENGKGDIRARTLAKIQAILEGREGVLGGRGVVFLDAENGLGPGVRLNKPEELQQ